MAATILQFPAPVREMPANSPVSFDHLDEPMLDAVLEWLRGMFRVIVDGPLAASMPMRDLKMIERTAGLLTSPRPLKPSDLRRALWGIDGLIVVRDRDAARV